jgi:hypothetical protein
MTFEWKIIFIWPETTVGQNQVPKITFVIEENSDKEFKSSIAVDVLWEKTNLIKQYKTWDTIKVYLNFRSNEYEGKWFNRITAWKIEWWNSSGSSTQSDDLPF